jgi:peptidoglycan/LPS O-acetylase OafA/YrhL
LGVHTGGIHNWIGFSAGYAVAFFFVISGFLISFALSHKYSDTKTGLMLFYRGRFLRIFPLYWVLLVFCLLVFGGMQGRDGLIHYFTSIIIFGGDWVLAFSNYPVEQTPYPDALGQMWSVAAELTFYLMSPWLLRSFSLSFVCLGLSLYLRVWLEYFFGFHQAWDYHFFPSTLCLFLLGHVVRVAHDGGIRIPLKYFIVLIPFCAITSSLSSAEGGFPSKFFYFSVGCFAVMLPQIFNATKNSKVLNYLGDLSYPIYLSHMMLLTIFYPVGKILLPFPESVIQYHTGIIPVLAFLVFCIVVSILIHHFIQKPVLWYTNKLIEEIGLRIKIYWNYRPLKKNRHPLNMFMVKKLSLDRKSIRKKLSIDSGSKTR